jgi:triacylglycerol lipase
LVAERAWRRIQQISEPESREKLSVIPALRAPIVLVHGLLGYDELRMGGWTVSRYFAGVPSFLRQAGNRVLAPRLSPTAGVASRAAQLKAFLDREVADEPVHLLAHSMGGLDCRYMISRLDMGQRVRTLTTIATPHRGTAFADWGVQRFGRIFKPFLDWLDVPAEAFFDLTTDRCREFNDQVPDAPGVRYSSVVGRYNGELSAPEWLFPYHIVLEAEGANDGIVSIASATYGERTEVWDGDHLSLVNWQHPINARRTSRDRTPDYLRLIHRLADEGF